MSEQKQMVAITRKQCSMCKDWRPVTDFHKESKKLLGLQSRCRFCKHIEAEERKKKLESKGVSDGAKAEELHGA